MGWLWSSPAPPASASPSESQSSLQSPLTSQQPLPPSEASISTPAPRKPTRDELADSEFHSLLEELEADLSISSSKYNHVPQPPPPHSKTSPAQTTTVFSPSTSQLSSPVSPTGTTLEDSVLPTEMSCRQAFDAAFYCQSFGGQFNHVYRFGGVRSCSENWADFWFCMRSKSFPTSLSPSSSDGLSVKEERIRAHYRRKMMRYKVGPSSEDVWAGREERLGWGEAFCTPVDKEERMSDEQWNVIERDRRERRVREIEGRS